MPKAMVEIKSEWAAVQRDIEAIQRRQAMLNQELAMKVTRRVQLEGILDYLGPEPQPVAPPLP